VRTWTWVGVILGLAFAMANAQPAAGEAPPGDVAAVDVYREVLPTAAGPVVVTARNETFGPLQPNARSALRSAGSAAPPLERAARSSLYGAPQRPSATRAQRRTVEPDPRDSGWSLRAGAAAVGASARSGGGVLIFLLVVTTVVLAVVRWAPSIKGRRLGPGHRDRPMVQPLPDNVRAD
jgi:hypothetical protein